MIFDLLMSLFFLSLYFTNVQSGNIIESRYTEALNIQCKAQRSALAWSFRKCMESEWKNYDRVKAAHECFGDHVSEKAEAMCKNELPKANATKIAKCLGERALSNALPFLKIPAVDRILFVTRQCFKTVYGYFP